MCIFSEHRFNNNNFCHQRENVFKVESLYEFNKDEIRNKKWQRIATNVYFYRYTIIGSRKSSHHHYILWLCFFSSPTSLFTPCSFHRLPFLCWIHGHLHFSRCIMVILFIFEFDSSGVAFDSCFFTVYLFLKYKQINNSNNKIVHTL